MSERRRARLDLRALLAALGIAGLVALVAYAAGSGSPITSTRLPLVHVSESPTPSFSLTATPGGGRSMSDTSAMIVFAVIALIIAIPLAYALVRLALVLLGITNRNDVIGSRWTRTTSSCPPARCCPTPSAPTGWWPVSMPD